MARIDDRNFWISPEIESIREWIKVYYDDLIETYYGEYATQLAEVQEGK